MMTPDEKEAVISAVIDELETGPLTPKAQDWCAKQLRELIGAPPQFRMRFTRVEVPANAE